MNVSKKLINEVEKHPLLYDSSHKEYNDAKRNLCAWESVGLATDKTGFKARKRWENIHRAYIRSKTAGNTYRFASLLGFLEVDGNKILPIMNVSKKLINEVEKHPLLYDSSHKEYNDAKRNLCAWESVGLATDKTGFKARKRWENIHRAYIRSKTAGNTYRFASLLGFLEVDGNKILSPIREESNCTSIPEYANETHFVERTVTPKTKKRKLEVDKSYVEEAEISEVNICDSPPPIHLSTTSLVGMDEVDSFCQLIAEIENFCQLIAEVEMWVDQKKRKLEVDKSYVEEAEISEVNICDSPPPIHLSTTSLVGMDEVDSFCQLIAEIENFCQLIAEVEMWVDQKKRKLEVDKSYVEEAEISEVNICDSPPPIHLSTTSLVGMDEVDSFCQLIAEIENFCQLIAEVEMWVDQKKRKLEVDKSYVEEAEISEVNICDSPPPIHLSTTSLVGMDEVDSFCQLIAEIENFCQLIAEVEMWVDQKSSPS